MSTPTMNKSLVGTVHIRGPRWARLPLLTMGVLGLQIVWTVEMAYGN
jgi:solute carrier family 45 protein 1/2/4